MATFTRRAAVGVFMLIALVASQGVANAQFSYGWTRYGYNPSNPFVAQQQYLSNLQANAYAIRAGAQVPASLPYLAAYSSPYYYRPYVNTGYGYNPYAYTNYGSAWVNPYVGGYVNPYGAAGYWYSNPYGR